MGLFSGAKAQISGQKAIRTHISANQAANEGKLSEAKEKYTQAHKLYEEAVREKGQKPSVHQGFAILLMRMGEFDRAMAIMEALRLDKSMTEADWFDLRLNYSICLWKKGRLDDAIATGKRAFQLKKTASIYSTLGMFLVEKADETGDFSEAEAFNREAMDYDDEDAGVLDNMGEMYEAMAKRAADPAEYRARAKAYYAKAHAEKPRQITTIYSLASMYHQDGEDAEARKVLADAKDLYYSAVCSVSEDMMEALRAQVG